MEAYTKERQLGRGAMGSVYLVRRHADGLQLAMKTVASEFASARLFAERGCALSLLRLSARFFGCSAVDSARDRTLALNELAILRSLAHTHVVSFVDGERMHTHPPVWI